LNQHSRKKSNSLYRKKCKNPLIKLFKEASNTIILNFCEVNNLWLIKNYLTIFNL